MSDGTGSYLSPSPYGLHAKSLYVTGRLDEAEDLFQELTGQIPDSVSFRGYLGSVAARRGDRDKAVQISDSLVTLDRPHRFGSIYYWQARIAAVLGDRDRAIGLLHQAFDAGFEFTEALHRDEDLLLLHGYEPFEELMRPEG